MFHLGNFAIWRAYLFPPQQTYQSYYELKYFFHLSCSLGGKSVPARHAWLLLIFQSLETMIIPSTKRRQVGASWIIMASFTFFWGHMVSFSYMGLCTLFCKIAQRYIQININWHCHVYIHTYIAYLYLSVYV